MTQRDQSEKSLRQMVNEKNLLLEDLSVKHRDLESRYHALEIEIEKSETKMETRFEVEIRRLQELLLDKGQEVEWVKAELNEV